MLTTAEAAAMVGVDRSHIRRLIQSGKLKAVKRGPPGRDWYEIDTADLDAYRQSHPRSKAGRPRKDRGMTQAELVALIQERGLPYAAQALTSVKNALIDGWDLTRWRTREVSGAALFFQVRDGLITDEPRILCVHAPEADRARWEALLDASDAPVTVLMLPAIST